MRRTFRGIGPFLPTGTTMSDQEYADWYEEHAWDPSRYNDLRLERDLAPAAWLEPLLSPRSFDVSMTAPRGYEAYARLFFPFLRSGLGASGEWSERRVRWTEMAEQSGKVVHALMEQETISTAPDGQGTADRCTDQLSPEQFKPCFQYSPVTPPRQRAGSCCGTASVISTRGCSTPAYRRSTMRCGISTC
jgi:hypothetical protein